MVKRYGKSLKKIDGKPSKPPKRGQNIIIHGVENLTIYASIDHNAKADPVPEDDPAENEDEDDIWGTLPSRRGSLNDDDD